MEPRLYFLSIETALSQAYSTARSLVRLFNSSGEQIYQFTSFQWGLHWKAVEHLHNEVAYATIEAPHHTATGWGMKGT